MINYKERGVRPMYDFVNPVLDFAGRPYEGLTYERTETDYSTDMKFLPPPNFLRGLLSKESIDNLTNGFDKIAKKYPRRFDHFNIHLRGLYENNKLELVWDVLTYVNFDGREIYAPVNVSFSHSVMTSKWSEDPNEDFILKRRIVESQIMDVTTIGAPRGPEAAVYGVAIPEKFSHGITDKIFMDYPSYELFSPRGVEVNKEYVDWVRGEYGAVKKNIASNGKESVLYLWRGKSLRTRSEFESITADPAFLDYCTEISTRWSQNFGREVEISNQLPLERQEKDDALETRARTGLLQKMGAL